MSYSKLRGKIREVFGTQEAFAKAMEKDNSTISAKLNNNSPWTNSDIETACVLLGIPINQVHEYFFCRKSLEIQTEK